MTTQDTPNTSKTIQDIILAHKNKKTKSKSTKTNKTNKTNIPSTSYLTEDQSHCLSCKTSTLNSSDTFTLTRNQKTWGLTLRCAQCGKGKHSFLRKNQTTCLPKELQDAEIGTVITQADYEDKYGGILPLVALLPLIFKGVAAAVGAAGAATGIAKAVEESRHNKELENIARGNAIGKAVGDGINSIKDNKDPKDKIEKYVKFLQGYGFDFYLD